MAFTQLQSHSNRNPESVTEQLPLSVLHFVTTPVRFDALKILVDTGTLTAGSAKYLHQVVTNIAPQHEELTDDLYVDAVTTIAALGDWQSIRNLPEMASHYGEHFVPLIRELRGDLAHLYSNNREALDKLLDCAKAIKESPCDVVSLICELPSSFLSNTPEHIFGILERFRDAAPTLLNYEPERIAELMRSSGEFLDKFLNLTNYHRYSFTIPSIHFTKNQAELRYAAELVAPHCEQLLKALAEQASDVIPAQLIADLERFGACGAALWYQSYHLTESPPSSETRSLFTPFWEFARGKGYLPALENCTEVFQFPELLSSGQPAGCLQPAWLEIFEKQPDEFVSIFNRISEYFLLNQDCDLTALLWRMAESLDRVYLHLSTAYGIDATENLVSLVQHHYPLFKELKFQLGSAYPEVASAITSTRWIHDAPMLLNLAKRYHGALIGILLSNPLIATNEISRHDYLLSLANRVSPYNAHRAVSMIPFENLEDYLNRFGEDAYIAYRNDNAVPEALQETSYSALSLPLASRIPHLYRFHNKYSVGRLLEEAERNLDPGYKPDRPIILYSLPWEDHNDAFRYREERLFYLASRARLLLADCSTLTELMIHVIRAGSLFGLDERGKPIRPIHCYSLCAHANYDRMVIGRQNPPLFSLTDPLHEFQSDGVLTTANDEFFTELADWIEPGGHVCLAGCLTGALRHDADTIAEVAARYLIHQNVYATRGISYGMNINLNARGIVQSVAARGCGTLHIPPR